MKGFRKYTVLESNSQLFGFNVLNKGTNERIILAKSKTKALKRYFKIYYRVNKEVHRFCKVCRETTPQWGEMLVIDDKGYKTYYDQYERLEFKTINKCRSKRKRKDNQGLWQRF